MPFKGLAFNHRIGGGQQFARYFAAFVLILIFYAAGPALSQSRVLNEAILSNSEEQISLGPYAIVQKDPEEKITTQDIADSGGTILKGKQAGSKRVFLGFDGVPVWMTIKVKNITDNEEWVLNFGRRRDGRLGSITDAHVYEMVLGDSATPVSITELKNKADNGMFEIKIAKNERKFLLVHATPAPGRPTTLPLSIESDKSYIESAKNRAVFNAFYCLVLGGLAVFFFINAIVTRRAMPIIFGAYYAFIGTFWVLYDTLGASLYFKGFNELSFVFFLGHALISIFMMKIFCNIGQNSYTEKYVIYGLIWLNIISSLLFYFIPVGSGIAHILFLFGIPFLTLGILTLMAYAQYRNGQTASPLFAISFVLPLVGYIVNILGAINVLPQDNIFINAFWWAIIPQGFVLIATIRKHSGGKKYGDDITEAIIAREESSNFSGLRETKEKADHARLLKVIEKEREMLAELREKEAARMEEMKRAKEEADEANRAKSAFLAVVSHEIRTPMTGVMGMVKLLLDSSITKQQRDYALTIQESSEAMLALLNDILDLEKIQRGKMELEDISFDLHRLIQGVVTLMSGHAAEKHIGLSARMDEDIPKFVKGDPTRLRQVLLNLMGNAIKFTSEGSVTLLVKNLNTADGDEAAMPSSKHMIYFGVQDSGIGIPQDAQKNLFNPFSQANSSIGRKFGGTGLGLAISKGLIEAMGSSVNISSKEGEGSTFFFTLEMNKGLAGAPEKSQPMMQSPAQNTAPVRPLKILVVDDNVITRKVVTNLLQTGGHEIVTSGTAEDALQKIYKDAFELILMDIELPGMRGNEATQILREHADPVKSKIPVIAMTGNVQKENMEFYLACGMNGFLPKPIDPERLSAIVSEIASETYERKIRMPEDPFAMNKEELEEKAAPKKDLVVDNAVFNPDMLQSLKDTIGGKQLDELLGDLIVKTDEILEAMQKAADVSDMVTLAARAHELKGMAGNFGLVEISSIAAQAERKAKTQETAGLGSLLGTLPDASTRAKSVLKEWSSH